MLISEMERVVFSIIIPCRNASKTIKRCLESVFNSSYRGFEVIVVDDSSIDDSVRIAKEFPCKVITLSKHSGAGRARNEGARNASGEVLFFIDSDCMFLENTLETALYLYKKRPDSAIGGTYTKSPLDRDFFSRFQSLFINYSETKSPMPDYLATHALVIKKDIFWQAGGFREDFPLPIIEDVEFSHRLKKHGITLLLEPRLQVIHIFNFSLIRSIKNAFRKALYWTAYSIGNKDILRDSGTASHELKINVIAVFLSLLFTILGLITGSFYPFISAILMLGVNIFFNREFLRFLAKNSSYLFFIGAFAYYMSIYAISVGIGALFGLGLFLKKGQIR